MSKSAKDINMRLEESIKFRIGVALAKLHLVELPSDTIIDSNISMIESDIANYRNSISFYLECSSFNEARKDIDEMESLTNQLDWWLALQECRDELDLIMEGANN